MTLLLGSVLGSVLGSLLAYEWCFIGLIVAVIAYYYISWRNAVSYWKDRHICGPKPIPIFGNILGLYLNPGPLNELQWYKKYGKIYGLYMSSKPTLTVADPQLIQQILVKDFNIFRNRPVIPGTDMLAMTTARDEDWKRIRAIANPTFTSGKIRKMYGIINHCGQDFIGSLDKDVSNGVNEVELKRLMGAYTMDVIASCAFAAKTNTYADPNNPFTTNGANITNGPGSIYKRLLRRTLPTLIVSSNIYRKLLGPRGSNAAFFVDFTRSLIKKRRDNNEKHNDFLQLLMDAERPEGDIREASDANEAHHVNEGKDEMKAYAEAFTGVSEKKLTEDEILAQCFLFFIAGYETTSTALSFCAYELALNPGLQDRLYEETKEAFNEKGEMDYSVLSRLPFIDALLSETLRHYPPISRLPRTAAQDVMLGSTGVKIEKGVSVEIPVYAIHHDPDHYPDPFTFNPDRFMPQNRDHIQPYTYLPFGSGPRNCIGMRFALLSAKLVLAKISHSFRFSRVTDTDVPVIYTTTLLNKLLPKRLVVGVHKR
ncbi:unnamed protein product [Oppiella nova]|uniref:Cytochrome P450 n=1 Tax=Oppiella nova TaxID=334625 RepID=A0A7R9QLT6_9ACAR|nr:unnamed protein product [Oppiella nova]CAG2168522.1 unnamed protein product [Oppiella nova]